jgi:hypothetical protein
MRVAVDVSPLSHVRTGVGTFLLGMIRGLVENGVEVVAFTPVSVRYRGQIERALGALDVERRLPVILLAHKWRTLWSRLQWPPAERWLGHFDVLHFSDWMYPPQRSGVRATTVHDLVPLHNPEWTYGLGLGDDDLRGWCGLGLRRNDGLHELGCRRADLLHGLGDDRRKGGDYRQLDHLRRLGLLDHGRRGLRVRVHVLKQPRQIRLAHPAVLAHDLLDGLPGRDLHRHRVRDLVG